jgi:signal transduction histidine kinase
VERARITGLDVTLTITGDPPDLPAPTDRAIYRIVQESLTNVTRHAGASSATVVLDHLDDRVVVRVTDDGRARPGDVPQPGMGLTGMRERVAALDGSLTAQPRPDGGFAVVAELPLSGDRAANGSPGVAR